MGKSSNGAGVSAGTRVSYLDDIPLVSDRVHAINPDLQDAIDSADEDELQINRRGQLRVQLYHPCVEVDPGVVCAQVVNHYTHGQCALLCQMLLEELADADPVNVLIQGSMPAHTLVQIDENTYLDVKGVRTREQVLADWTSQGYNHVGIDELTREEWHRCWSPERDGSPLAIEVARTYARVLVDQHCPHYAESAHEPSH